MKWKIIRHINKENGHVTGYSLAYKPFPLIPYWVHCKERYSLEMAEHTIIFQMMLEGKVKKGDVFE